MKVLRTLVIWLFAPAIAFTQSQSTILWKDITQLKSKADKEIWIQPDKYRLLELNYSGMSSFLDKGSIQKSNIPKTISIPLPNGTEQDFFIQNSEVMHPGLASKFPNIKTYRGEATDDPSSIIYLDITPAGFHAMILSPKGDIYIDPHYKKDNKTYVSYFKKNYSHKDVKWTCDHQNESFKEIDPVPDNIKNKEFVPGKRMAAVTLKTYRLAFAAQGEYTTFHGGTVASGQAAVVTTINRVSGVYEKELAIRLQLIANNDQIIYTNAATDPYSANSDAVAIENDNNLNTTIGSANYDVGHVVNTSGGGVAGLGVICSNNTSNYSHKAHGMTGLPNPVGDPFDIDYVAHELGHQFGGNHTFNGSTGSCSGQNRNGSTAYEPGSGSTIQAYADICSPQNIQNASDAYFHLASLNEMNTHVTSGSGATCDAPSITGNNYPVANADEEGINNKSIPINTPFELTGSATDVDNDVLTYCWEEWDLGPQGNIDANSTTAPIFRSFSPTTSPTRIFPKLSNILAGTTITYGEILPAVARTLKFQFTARDNKIGGGGFHSDMISLNVVNSGGAFSMTSQNTAAALSGSINVTWDVAGTTTSPISCANVDILFSSDGGQTFSTTIASNETNDGSASIALPNVTTAQGRIKIKCSDNVFFDINNADLSVTPFSNCNITNFTATAPSACDPNTSTYSSDITVTYTLPPATGNLVINGQSFAKGTSPQTETITLSADGNPVNVTAAFSDDSGCTMTSTGLFTAPAACTNCDITAIIAGSQSQCNVITGNYTQDVEVTYSNAPGTGTLNVNGQSFAITTSPQTVTLIDLPSDGNSMDVTASFSAIPICNFTVNDLFTARTPCLVCQTFSSTSVPKTIADNATSFDTINITQTGSITDVDIIDLNGTHTWVGDLRFRLISPEGTTVNIISRQCGNNDNFSISLDDDSTDDIDCPYTDGNFHTPSSSLSAYNNEDPEGNWILEIRDFQEVDNGILNGWGLKICGIGVDTCNTPLISITGDITGGGYRSGGVLESDANILSGTVSYKAPTSIELDTHFNVVQGAIFTAEIENCVNNFKKPRNPFEIDR